MKLIIHDKNGMRARTVKPEYAAAYRNRYKNEYLTWTDKNNNVHIDFCHRPEMVQIHERHSTTKDPISYFVTQEYALKFISNNPQYVSMKDGSDYYIDFTQRLSPEAIPA